MVKKGKTRVTITINEKLLQLIQQKGNASEYINKCIMRFISDLDTPNYLELENIGIDPNKQDCYKEMGWYDK